MSKQEAATIDLELLNPFVGAWDTEGEVRDFPSGQSVRFKATDIYEWLHGGYFLLHRFDADMPAGNIQGIEIIGYREESKSYSMHSFDSLGNASVMQARLANGIWSFTGDNVRFTGGFRENGIVFAGLWELCSGDSSTWQPWMDVRLTKIR